MHFNKNHLLFLILLTTLFFDCGGNKLPIAETNKPDFPDRKVYVVLRSEGNTQQLKNIIANDFLENNISTNFSTYQARQTWNQNQIFQTAYNGNYDYILLVDQVAKFTIDGRTQVGGKYQLRSYHVKSPDPNWLDLGQETCNISVKPSIQKFSRILTRSIVGNAAVFKKHDFKYDDAIASTSKNSIEKTATSRGLNDEIERLKKELEAEKQRTKLAELERLRIEKELQSQREAERLAEQKHQKEIAEQEALIAEKQRIEKEKTQITAAQKREERRLKEEQAFKIAQQRRELAQQKKLEKEILKQEIRKAKELNLQKKEAERLAELKRKEEKAYKEAQEQKRLAELQKTQRRKAETLKKKRLESKNIARKSDKKPKQNSNNSNVSVIKMVNAYIAILGKQTDNKSFKDLKDNIEFDFMFAKAKSNIEIFNTEIPLSRQEIAANAKADNNIIIIIHQGEYVGDGKYQYEISFTEKETGNNWKNNIQEVCNLSLRDDLKTLSKKVTDALSN